MAKSSYQIPYHDLDAPLNPPILPPEYSSLHTLYPGVPMLRNDIFDRYYIPHCDPDEACKSFKERRENTIKSAKHLEFLARSSAGGPDDKVTIHAVEDPSMIVEDPALTQLSTQSPTALNDGMEYPLRSSRDSDNGRGVKENFQSVDHLPTSQKQAIQPANTSVVADSVLNGESTCVFISIGFLVLIILLMGAFLGKR